jgi:hypothetical protein
MKRIWILGAVVALAGFTVSCEDNFESTPEFKPSDAAFSITTSTQSIAVTAADSLDEVIMFTWPDPQYTLGLDNSKFTVKVGANGSNFSSFQTKEFNGVLTGSLTGKEVNGMALKFGGLPGTPIVLDVMAIASQSNNNEPKNSNVVQVTVTPYGDLTAAASVSEVELEPGSAGDEALELEWSTAFNGFNGVKTYQLQYDAGASDFASPVSVDVTSFNYSFTHFQLNKLALENGVAPGQSGIVDFRVKATNELGTVLYSNVVEVEITTYIAFNAIGIIGDASPGGWDTDTDMYRPDATKPTEWTAIVYLVGGKAAKFRADDAWTDNWGAATFPTGTGTQNGANIPVSTSGYYEVDMNVATGAYSFELLTTPVYNFVSLIGAQSSWGADIVDLTKDPVNSQVWTGTVHLTAGELKFRANHDWGTNWGITSGTTNTNLSGIGSLNGGNMVISEEGDYFVYINTATKEYFFGKADRGTAFADVGVIGNATPGGWDNDTNLIKNPSNPYKWSGFMTLVAGESKFRANNDWGVNWGGNTFPNGVATQNGPNIPSTAGTYYITFNSATGEYTFLK